MDMRPTRKMRRAKPVSPESVENSVENQDKNDANTPDELIDSVFKSDEDVSQSKWSRATQPAIPRVMGLKKVKPKKEATEESESNCS